MQSLVAHLDADCFYVSAERVRDDALNHVPATVIGNQGACIIAKSYEAKASGIKTGMPIWEAVKICPSAVHLKRDFRWYEVLSRMLLELLRTVSPTVEYYSIDEMFFDARELPSSFSLSLSAAAQALQCRIMDEIGIPVSMGISRTRTIAKLISDTAKPFGCRVLLDEAEIAEFLANHPVEEITGIAERSRRKLAAHGIQTCLQYRQAERTLIRKLLTIKGEGLWWELHGEPITPIQTIRPKHKCIGRGGSLGGATADLTRLVAWGARNVERLIEELDFHQVHTKRMTLAVMFRGGPSWAGRAYFLEPTALFSDLFEATRGLLTKAHDPCEPITHMHLLADALSDRRHRQLSLFSNVGQESTQVAQVKREINNKLGRFVLRSGETLPLADIYRDEAQDYDICDIRGKMCF